MRQTLTLATACINTTPLDLDGNLALIRQAVDAAATMGADLLLCPELSLTGYGCEDMFFVADWLDALPAQVAATPLDLVGREFNRARGDFYLHHDPRVLRQK